MRWGMVKEPTRLLKQQGQPPTRNHYCPYTLKSKGENQGKRVEPELALQKTAT
jgi:hypothetical protein